MTFDTIIIGGGIIGCTTGFFLSRRGHKILLIDRAEIATGTTANSFAWANATTKTNDAAYHALNLAGQQGYYALADEFGADTLGLKPKGALHLATQDDPENWAETKEIAQALDALNYPSEWLSPAQLRALEPNMTFPPEAHALYTPTDISINAPHFTRFLVAKIIAMGGVVRPACQPLELLATDAGTVTGIRTETDSYYAPNVIVATGANTPQTLADLTGYDGFTSGFPMATPPGLILTTPPLPDALLPNRIILTSRTRELHILPEFNGGLKIASDDIDGLIISDQSPENLTLNGQRLLTRCQTLIPDLPNHVDIKDCTLGIGVRPYPTDGKTIAGPMPDAQGLYVIATHSGITLAPAIGTLMAELVMTGNTPAALAPFGIERFAGFGGTV